MINLLLLENGKSGININQISIAMKNVLLILLLLIAIIMIILGIRAGALPPAFTGIGFILVSALFYKYT